MVFQEYSMDYGHCLNLGKSSIYSSSIIESNVNSIIASSSFSRGSFPFNYLGILIFKGRIKYSYLSHSSDIILNKLSSWKGSLLYMVGRLILVKSIIQGMIYYIINIYSWPLSLLRRIEGGCRNFLWTVTFIRGKFLWFPRRKLVNCSSREALLSALWLD